MSIPAQKLRQRSATESSLASRERITAAQDYTMPPTTISTMMRHFDPCVATADMFLYAQGNSIVCCHHDTLTIERRFSRHPDEVLLLAVDNQSERGSGRLVVSYDASQNAIVWDIMSGNEIARFASFSNLTAVAWMRNGAVAFGNDSGTIILFEPETSEHVSFRTIDQIAVTALAPATDCRTFAIGYQNGSVLICNLQPRFTILHNLTTSRGPSPIVGLSWHASSTRQRSDMLAVQTYDGDLRVWSVAKSHNGVEPAKVVRILKRTDNYFPGPNWMNWSKNGRIIQFSEGETLSWDVRTKHVTYDSIPTLEHVRGLAVYGPGASLFTLGANNTVQQFDLNAPAVLVADVQHPANLLPPSPPVSVEEQEKQEKAAAAAAAAASGAIETDSSVATTSESEISIHLDGGVSESDDDFQSPLARLVNAGHIVDDTESDIARTTSATSSAVSHISEDKSETSSKTPGQYAGSVQSRGMTEYTYMSIGSSLKSSIHPNNMYQQPQQHQKQQQPHRRTTPNPQRQSVATYSTATSTTVSTASSRTGMSRPSRLRNEVPRSPDDAKVLDLFKFTRSRLSDVPYRMPPAPANGVRLTNDDLRRQMLYTIFGWTEDIGDLVRDEMDRYPAGSANRILLAKWLGDIDPDIMKASSETMTSSDWMLLALSGIGSQASQHKLGRAYTQRLLESGDVHAAATIMIGMGDCNDAIEIYASHHKYMEALIVAALFFPSVWERQSHLIKKWGEWAIKNGRRELAIRCAACTGKESSEPWTSPSAAQINFPSINSALPELNSPPLSPPSLMQRGPQRSIAKSSALRLITNFSDATSNTRAQIFASDADGATPVAAGVTPIVESAISPGHNDATTAFLRPSQRSVFNTPSSARPTGGGFGRQRLPSIGEGPQGSQDANHPRNVLKGVSDALGVQSQPVESIDAVAQAPAPAPPPVHVPQMVQVDNGNNLSIGMALQRASTSSPLYRRKEQPPPSPSPASLAMLMDGRHSRNGPRNRIPQGVDMQLAPVAPETIMDMTSPEQTGASSNRYRWPTRRRGPASVSSSITSNSSIGHGPRSNRFRTGEAPNTSKTLDEYINSLEVVNAKAARSSSKDRHQRSRDINRQRRPSVNTPSASSVSTVTSHSREPSSNTDVRDWVQTRSRAGSKTGGKRSPRSPVPMSPEDLISLTSTPRMFARDEPASVDADMASLTAKKTISTSSAAPPPVSMQLPQRPSSKSRPTSRASSRGRSTRNRSPDRQPLALDIPRGRNSSRTASAIRSPSSPLPFSNNAAQYRDSDDEEDYQRAVEAQEKFRNRDRTSQRGRSSSQGRRDASPGSVRTRERSRSRRRPTPDVTSTAAPVTVSRKERILAGPPPAPSAMAVAAGGFDRYPASQQSLGEELGRRRTQSAMTNRGDLRQLSKDERAQRKAAAARELEERRKSLVRHPNAPPIMHPDYLSPGLNQTFGQITEAPELTSDVYSRPTDLPMRSQSTEPTATQSSSSRTRSMFAPRGHQSIGLPATPKAMRLVLEPGAGAGSSTPPSVPPIPAVYGHQRTSSGSAGRSSPETKPSPKRNVEPAPAPLTLSATTYSLRSEVPPAPKTSVPTKTTEDTLTLLPSTVYQPPSMSRAAIPRSMSAPPQELVYNKDFSASRKASREKNPTIPESSNDNGNDLAGTLSPTIYRRPSLDNMIPPPPPPLPAPPMLKELAHLAVPPPPPPAPLPFGSSMNKPVVYGGHTTGTIEVVMDDGEVQPVVTISPQNTGNGNGNNNGSRNSNAPQYANYPPPPPPPPSAPPIAQENLSQSRNGHQRGRSSTDNSIAGRISRATERIRSASRGPNAASRTKSPEITMVPYESIQIPQAQSSSAMGYAPYESVPMPPASSFASRNSPPQLSQMQFQPQQMQQQMQQQQHQQLTQQQLAQQQLQLQQIEYQNQMRTGLHQSEMI